MHHQTVKRAMLVVALTLVNACAPTTAVPSPSPQASPTLSFAAASPTVSPSRPTPAAYPSLPRPTTPIPAMRPLPQYAGLALTLTVEDHIGQPSESIVWTTKAYRPDAGHVARAAAALGVEGPGTVGDAPGGSAPWRLWLGAKVLAVNERTGDVLFFDPKADDGPRPNGPAQRDPALFLSTILASLGTTVDVTPEPGRNPVFRGTDSLWIAEPAMEGSWLGPGDRDGVVLFADAPNPYDPIYEPGTTIYDSDELGLVTSNGRPVEIVHHPFGTLSGGAIYPITTYRDAANELREDPKAYLRLLSAPLGEAVTLHVLPDGARVGSAWAGGAPTALTRAGRTLVPVWEFLAEGTSASGTFVRAMFAVDAVLPEFRAPATSAALALDADALLGRQLSVSVGGHEPWRMSAFQTAKSELASFGFPATTDPSLVMIDPDTASVTASDGQHTIGFTLRRAFPGLANSVWYLRDVRK